MKSCFCFRVLLLGLVPLFALAHPCYAQVTFERTYGGAENDWGYSVHQTQDGGYVVTGRSYSASWPDSLYLLKTNPLGDSIWWKAYNKGGYGGGHCVQQTLDGGYIIAGADFASLFVYSELLWVRTDALGDTTWTRTYGGPSWDYGRSLDLTQDGGCITTGNIGADVCLVKTDVVGNTTWVRTYDFGVTSYGYSVKQTHDGGYVLAGLLDSNGDDVLLIRTDSLGDTLWTRAYGGAGRDGGTSIEQTVDGGFIVAGWTESFGAGSSDVYLVKTDSVGDTAWTRTFGGDGWDRGNSVEKTQDGGYVVAGALSGDVYLVKTDSLGGTVWTRVYGGPEHEEGASVGQTADGGFIIAGCKGCWVSSSDIYLIKTDEDGLTGTEEERHATGPKQPTISLFQNTPNPFHSSTIISYALPQASEITMAIYDITGRLIETLVNETQQPGIHQIQWDRGEASSGVYFYRLKAGQFVETRMFILLR